MTIAIVSFSHFLQLPYIPDQCNFLVSVTYWLGMVLAAYVHSAFGEGRREAG